MRTTNVGRDTDQWWRDAALDAGMRRIVIVHGRHRHTCVRHRKTATVMYVSAADRATLTGSIGGSWTVAHATAMAASRHRHTRTLRTLIIAVAAAAASGVFVAVDGVGGFRLAGIVVAVLCGVGAGWLWHVQHSSRIDRILAADRAATDACDVAAAREALSGDGLYRSTVHNWVARHHILSAVRRQELIESRRPS